MRDNGKGGYRQPTASERASDRARQDAAGGPAGASSSDRGSKLKGKMPSSKIKELVGKFPVMPFPTAPRIPDKNPGQWQWVWNEYYNNRTYMQAGVMKNSVTGEIKKTAFRDIRNSKGQIQKSLLHAEGNAFRAKLNEENGYTAWAKEQARLKKIEQDRVAAEVKAKEAAAAKAAAKAKAAQAAAAKAKAAKEARAKAAAAKAAADKARKEAEAAKAAAKARAEEEARLAQIAEQKRIREEYEAKIAEEKRLREAAEKAQREAAERQRIEEERRRAEEARKAAEAEAARIAAEKARRNEEASKAAGYLRDREGYSSAPTPFTGESASVYNPPGYEEGKAAPLSGPTTVASETADEGSKVFAPGYIEGAIPQTISLPSATTTGMSQTVMYSNERGQQLPVTEIDGKAVTYVPPGFSKMAMAQGGVVGYAEGGDTNLDAKYQLATKFLGYKGPKTVAGLTDFAKANPGAGARMGMYEQAMARGGMVRGLAVGGDTIGYHSDVVPMFGDTLKQTMQPMQAPVEYMKATDDQMISPTAGQVYGTAPTTQAATVGQVAQAQAPTYVPASTYQAGTITPFVQAETRNLQAAQGQVGQEAQIQAQQQDKSAVSDLEAAQGAAFKMQNPVQRELQQGELISGAADAQKAAAFTEQVQAAEATPSSKATVQGQLEGLMQDFEGGATPTWAAGAMRNATATMAARGLGASSMAGQALVQAAMESALPIAQADAQTVAQFEAQNLSNRQQRAMLAAQQRAQFMGQEFDQSFQARVQNSARIGDIANMNFTAEQNIALENSRAVNTMNLANLSNRQAMVMAEASSLANLDMANLNNRQQAAVQNAQNFLAMDMANLNNEQQTAMFKAQQNIQSLFTDQAAENAAAQFNAANENQTRQFFSSLSAQTSQFNASQTNSVNQFNTNSINSIREFNSNLQQQRDTFNATNSLVVAQANAQWRQNIATLNTAAQNESNASFAATINAMTQTNLDAVWQRERDIMSLAFQTAESNASNATQIIMQQMAADATITAAELQAKIEATQKTGDFLSEVFLKIIDIA
jgi:hypothetical protein